MMDSREKTEEERAKLKEERRARNQQKKLARRLENQRKRDEEAAQLKMQPKCNYVKVVPQHIADKLKGNLQTGTTSQNQQDFVVDSSDFPTLNTKAKVLPKTDLKSVNFNLDSVSKKRLGQIELGDFLAGSSKASKASKTTESKAMSSTQYAGNPLDSAMPVRKRGKVKEGPKVKKVSKLKKSIMLDKTIAEPHEHPSEDKLFSSSVTSETENLIKVFITSIVDLQQKLYKRNPIKGTYKKRYVVGFHEIKKYLQLNRVKFLCFATDISVLRPNDTLSDVITELIEISKSNSIPYVFALKRRILGKLTLKFVPVSCIAVLNYDGVEEQYNEILQQFKSGDVSNKSSMDQTKTELLNNFMNALKCD